MFDIGSGEMMVILILALLLFGGRLPDVARSVGRSVGELKRGFAESTRPLRDAQDDVRREVAEVGEGKAADRPVPPPPGAPSPGGPAGGGA